MDRTGKAVLGQRLEEGMTTLTDSTLARAIYPGLTLMQISMAAPEEDGNGSRSTSTSKPSPKDWNRLKAEFTFYYMAYNKKGLPLREVRAILARKYGFIASDRMYKQRIKEWGLVKYEPRVPILDEADSRPSCHSLHPPNAKPRRHRSRPNNQRRPSRSSNSLSHRINPPMRLDVSTASSLSLRSNSPMKLVGFTSSSEDENDSSDNEDESWPLYLDHLPAALAAPRHHKNVEDILLHIERYYLSCFRGQGRMFSAHVLGSVNISFIDVDDGFTDRGLLEIHDPGYAAISLVKSRQYREARILLGGAQDKVKDLLRAQHPTLLPFILEIICEDSTTPEFNVSEWFRRYVCQLCGIIMGEQHSLTKILQLLGSVENKLWVCATILRKIQALLSAEFGASQWEARRPVKVFCRVLRHLHEYAEVEKILPTAMGEYGSLEKPTQSELLGLLYELAWLSARGRHDNAAATALFMEILRLTGRDAQEGQFSHFRIKALRGLGVLAREEARHDSCEQYFSAAWRESRLGFGRRDSNTVRIGSELEVSLRELGRFQEADQLRKERDELFLEEDEEVLIEVEGGGVGWDQGKARCGSGGRG